MTNDSLQQIFYGAPGTGKSHKVKSIVGTDINNHVRTTFHPDTDYSSFVGAYKPTMKKNLERVYGKQELIKLLKEIKDTGTAYPCQKFGAKYWNSLKPLKGADYKEILDACGFTDNFSVEIGKGISVGEELASKIRPEQIAYSFVAQSFLKAYEEAWKRMAKDAGNPEAFYLVIEEINRGNCAQIFGDLFQLLDRNDEGYSEYAITPDKDIKNYLAGTFKDVEGLPEDVKSGEVMYLPKNLYILATMNTSDQSLFPIDSAFKRRWDWEYVPITNANLGWKIEAAENKYDWWTFLEKINEKVGELTSSEDKKLGYFFAKAKNNVIDAKTFVSKVAFYLWNDVFKDYGTDSDIFKTDDKGDITFTKFFTQGGVDDALVAKFIENVGVTAEGKDAEKAPSENVEQTEAEE